MLSHNDPGYPNQTVPKATYNRQEMTTKSTPAPTSNFKKKKASDDKPKQGWTNQKQQPTNLPALTCE
jgi:hypothetical protein